MLKQYLKIIVLSLIPTTLVYIGKNDTSITWLQTNLHLFENTPTAKLMNISFFIGIFFTGLIIPIQLAHSKEKNKKLKTNYLKTIENKKRIFVEGIKSEIGQSNIHLNVRIFIIKKGFVPWVKKLFKKIIEFKIINIPGLAEIGNTDGLKFQVNPKTEGLVGFVYQERSMLYDDELEFSDQKEIYNLSDFQISKINGSKFILAVPLFNKKNEVEVIITMDSEDDIKINNNNINKWDLIATRYCQSMHHCVPFLVNN